MDANKQNNDLSNFFEDPAENVPVKDSNRSVLGKSVVKRFLFRISGGLIKNNKQANFVLIIFILVIIFISFLLSFNSFKVEPTNKIIIPAEAE